MELLSGWGVKLLRLPGTMEILLGETRVQLVLAVGVGLLVVIVVVQIRARARWRVLQEFSLLLMLARCVPPTAAEDLAEARSGGFGPP